MALPACEARIMQVPAATIVTVEPATVHTAGVSELNDTANPEVADAETVNGAAPNSLFASAPKVIVWVFAVHWA